MRFLHIALAVSLVLTTKASDDPTHDGQAAVRGHPKVAAGSGRQKPISETPLMSSEADSEEHAMPPVMTEDNAMMPSKELTNAHESNEAMIEEMSEHDQVIFVHEFKEALHELVKVNKDAVNEIVMKKAGIMGKLNTAKQNLFGQDGAATGRDPQQSGRASNGIFSNGIFSNGIIGNGIFGNGIVLGNPNPCRPLDPRTRDPFLCQCDPTAFNSLGQGNCNTATRDFNGREWCYLNHRLVIADLGTSSDCSDATPSRELDGFFWSHAACDTKPLGLPFFLSPRERRERIEELKKKDSLFFSNSRTCFVGDGDSVCFNSNDPDSVQVAVGGVVTQAVDGIVTEAVDGIVTDVDGIVTGVDKIVTDVDKIVTDVDKIVTDAVDKIVTKNAGIVGKLKTAKQNFIGHDGEITRSRFKPFSVPSH